MNLIKYITRNYSLRDHVLVVQALYKKNTSIKEIYYNHVVDIYENSLMDVYISPTDLKNNIARLNKIIKNNPGYASQMIKKGTVAINKLLDLPINLIAGNKNLENQKIIEITKLIKEKLFEFSGFFEFTHYLGRVKIKLTNAQIKSLGIFHNKRKEAFINSFHYLDNLYQKNLLLKKSKIINKKLNFLTSEEIIDYFQGKLDDSTVNKKQKLRMNKYICIYQDQSEKIETKNLTKLKKVIIKKEKSLKDISVKGTAINTGIVKGVVKVITQNTSNKDVPRNSIIVTQMSTPEMTPFLKTVKAIITDEGGLLCHAAIFAREFKIISLLGTKRATQIFKDGDLVEINTREGIAKKI